VPFIRLCVRTTNASKKRTREFAEQPSKRVKFVNAISGRLRVLLLTLEMECLVTILYMMKPDHKELLDARTTPDRELIGDV
jgi:hypothetical protein